MNFSMRKLLFLFLLIPTFLSGLTKGEFIDWWQEYRSSPSLPAELREMTDYFISSGLIEDSSLYWNHLNKYNILQITNYGYENFKQTVTRNYFTWVVSIDNPYASNLKALVPQLLVNLPSSEMHKIHPFFGYQESLYFNEITLYFLNFILKIGGAPYLEKLEEPLIGNPPFLTYNGKRVSQDIFNSLLEYLPVASSCDISKVNTIIEIGAGSGRTAFAYITLHPNSKYVIVDIPPALFVSQNYLADVFPDKKVFRFRPFDHFKEIKKEYESADIVFLTPDQLAKLPNKSADLFLAIDCIHEMKPESIQYYFNQANRLSKYVYFKCWQKTVVPFDGNLYTEQSYPVLANWTPIFKSGCIIPSDFFHAFYQIRD